MESNSEKSRRIVKNTVMLYFRMILVLVVSLYTSRIVLKELGIIDYGIYNVVGGLITIFTFINGSMSQATQRFLTYELGKNKIETLKKVFSTSLVIHISIALIVVLLGETIGLWYLYTYMVIPCDRFTAAFYVYQFSILIVFFTIISVPYNALIIAHEKMSAFAYFSFLDVGMKLVVVVALSYADCDKLILYGALLVFVSIIMPIAYSIYAYRNFEESRCVRFSVEKSYLQEMGVYAGWSLWGSFAGVILAQGLNLLLNAFFNPTVNAARGLAVQVQAVIRNFSSNFQQAMNPQITKSFASHENGYMQNLLFRGSLFSYVLYLIVALPVYVEIESLLQLWLVEVPNYTTIFIRLMLLISIFEVLASPINVSIQATGQVKKFETRVSLVLLLVIPLSIFALVFGAGPQIVFVIYLIMTGLAFLLRLMIAQSLKLISIKKYIKSVLLKALLLLLISFILPCIVHFSCNSIIVVLRIALVSLSAFISLIFSSFFIVFSQHERKLIINKIYHRLC